MHQRKLHLPALYGNDLSASRLKDPLSLWVREAAPPPAWGGSETAGRLRGFCLGARWGLAEPGLRGWLLRSFGLPVRYRRFLRWKEGTISWPPP